MSRALSKVIVAAARRWSVRRGPRMGAALAYYSAFSLAPMLLISIAVAGLVYGEAAVTGLLAQQLEASLGSQAAHLLQNLVEASQRGQDGVLYTVIGLALLFMGATTVFAELRSSLDDLWGVPPTRNDGFLAMLRTRALSFLLVLALGLLLLLFFVLGSAMTAMAHYASGWLGGRDHLAIAANFAASTVVLATLFAMIYHFLPSVYVSWRAAWTGAWLTALLYGIGQTGIGLYLGYSAVDSTYGAAGAFVVLLTWVYYSAQIFLFGAALTCVLCDTDPGAASEAADKPA